eukprot:c18165_g1_i2.p1 GENE.c18165_g1_i2~~c18165_g1_i2.p1  ORF type:complete len:527 (+),score=87.45 c18165_g1_i2:36-1616(+)
MDLRAVPPAAWLCCSSHLAHLIADLIVSRAQLFASSLGLWATALTWALATLSFTGLRNSFVASCFCLACSTLMCLLDSYTLATTTASNPFTTDLVVLSTARILTTLVVQPLLCALCRVHTMVFLSFLTANLSIAFIAIMFTLPIPVVLTLLYTGIAILFMSHRVLQLSLPSAPLPPTCAQESEDSQRNKLIEYALGKVSDLLFSLTMAAELARALLTHHLATVTSHSIGISKIIQSLSDLYDAPLQRSAVNWSALHTASVARHGQLFHEKNITLSCDIDCRLQDVLVLVNEARISFVIDSLLKIACNRSVSSQAISLKVEVREWDGSSGASLHLLTSVVVRQCTLGSGFSLNQDAPDSLVVALKVAEHIVSEDYKGLLDVSKLPGTGMSISFHVFVEPLNFVGRPTTDKVNRSSIPDVDVLLVDDDQRSCDMMADTLVSLGVSAEVCYSGQEAIKTLLGPKPKTFCIVMLDRRMPEMDGLETARLLRKQQYSAPLVGLTGLAIDVEVSQRFQQQKTRTKPKKKKHR